MHNLEELRKQIDRIDEQIITLLKKRSDVVLQVGAYKQTENLPPLDATRYAQVLETRVAQGVKDGLPASLIRSIWKSIHDFLQSR